jgi:hypothetical protein
MKMHCKDCRFWNWWCAEDEIAECRRAAPRPSNGEANIASWPSTHRDDWCGEVEVQK